MSEFHISPPTTPLRGTIRVPADKSISHRAAILGALGIGDTRVENFLPSETTHATLNCLRALGAEIGLVDATTLIVRGRGMRALREPNDALFCAGSGTTMRLLSGVCAGQNFLSILDGTPALKRRPMARVAEPLRAMGATILARDNGKLPPLAIRGGNLRGIDYTLPVASAQVKSAILLAALFADSPTTVREPSLSRDHTERMLQACGVEIEIRNSKFEIQLSPIPEFRISNLEFRIPADFSSAAFFLIAALLAPQSEICIQAVGVNPTRTGLLDALARMGAQVKIENTRDESGEPIADLIVRASELRATEISGDEVPRMIDEFPILAIAATQARGETIVRDAQELRVKESDRIGTLAQEIRKMGAQIEERADGFIIAGPTPLRGARVHAHNDHRLAMSLAVAALSARGETVIEGWECVADSFPNFEDALKRVTGD
ncbi:MAG: 3-phosphoshikimate 1-carboxyvinyltransferase [Chloroflexota bacterium]